MAIVSQFELNWLTPEVIRAFKAGWAKPGALDTQSAQNEVGALRKYVIELKTVYISRLSAADEVRVRYQALFLSALRAGVPTSVLRSVRLLEASGRLDAARKLLANQVLELLLARLGHLRRALRMAVALRIRVRRFSVVQYSFHNLITLQREFFLSHGAHPGRITDATVGHSKLRGCGLSPIV